jgi:hypothetical protein
MQWIAGGEWERPWERPWGTGVLFGGCCGCGVENRETQTAYHVAGARYKRLSFTGPLLRPPSVGSRPMVTVESGAPSCVVDIEKMTLGLTGILFFGTGFPPSIHHQLLAWAQSEALNSANKHTNKWDAIDQGLPPALICTSVSSIRRHETNTN